MERNTIDINLLIGTYIDCVDFRFSIVSDLTVPIINFILVIRASKSIFVRANIILG